MLLNMIECFSQSSHLFDLNIPDINWGKGLLFVLNDLLFETKILILRKR